MSDKSSTFAPEIGKVLILTSSGETDKATQGCDFGGITGRKTHTAGVRKKSEEPLPISGFSLFVLYMRPTYIQFYRIIFDILKRLMRSTHL